MTRRLLLGAIALLLVTSTACIGVGPQHDRLYVSDWKGRKERPMKLKSVDDWEYEGEHWERQVPPETAE